VGRTLRTSTKITPQPEKDATTRALLVGFTLVLALCTSAWAASEKVLYTFHMKDGGGGGNVTVAPNGYIYGTTAYGGSSKCSQCGVVFRLTSDENGIWKETVLHGFSGPDGRAPLSLVLDKAGNLYGTTVNGGPMNQCSNEGCGLVFELERRPGGKWIYTVLHYFSVSDGAWPSGGLIFDSEGNLYGATSSGGNTSSCQGGCGVIFELTPGSNGQWTESVLYSFQGSDGEGPNAPLAFDSVGNIYGTTQHGGAHGSGTVFKLSLGTKGEWAEQILHSFNFDTADGYWPTSGLTFDVSGNLYGMTTFGGTKGEEGWGTAFRLTEAQGGKWQETVLHRFDRNKPEGGLVSSGLLIDSSGNPYGTTAEGGKDKCAAGGGVGCGVLFELKPQTDDKWTEIVLHSFGNGNDGTFPGGVVSSDWSGHVFGVTEAGGYVGGPCAPDGCGVVYEIAP